MACCVPGPMNGGVRRGRVGEWSSAPATEDVVKSWLPLCFVRGATCAFVFVPRVEGGGYHRNGVTFEFQKSCCVCCVRRLVEAGAAVPGAPSAATAEGSFVVESIVRSKGSLNEITIVEGQQFIGEESMETAAPEVPQCSAAGGSPVSLFGGAVHGSLFEVCGDSSDYFCGVSCRGREPLCCLPLATKQNFNVSTRPVNWNRFFFAIVVTENVRVHID